MAKCPISDMPKYCISSIRHRGDQSFPSAETSGDYSRAATKTFIVVEPHTRIMKRFVSSIPSCFSPSAFVKSFTSLLMAFSRTVALLASTWTPFKGVASGL